ncbi:MAG: ABC transporter ATP-binding protein [Thermoanaerobaculia bacterium]|nr:ABC transporter ATP-binding protein [Thermoanaerobaculia bacterium]
MPTAIDVVNLTKTYGEFTAIEKLSFSVGEGRILGLVGPNGAGKTTTLRAIGGIHPPTEGSVSICGIDLRDRPVDAKKLLAFMPDEPRLFDYLTVEEHLRFVARIYQVTAWQERAAELLAELELDDKRKALPGELSRGMKQKLMIACGLIHSPRVLVFDEPLTGLDPLGIRRMKDTIRKRSADGAAIILSSHLLGLVEELCDRVVIIHKGRKAAEGSIDALTRTADAVEGSLEDAFISITSRVES